MSSGINLNSFAHRSDPSPSQLFSRSHPLASVGEIMPEDVEFRTISRTVLEAFSAKPMAK
jgi:hypothetical protein